MINCNAGGTCDGGNPAGVYEYAHTKGLPHTSCEQYTAYNLVDRDCDAIDVCRDCTWPPPAEGDSGLENCQAVEFPKYYVSEYYKLSGADQMKAELYANGPISCGMDVTDAFLDYDGTYIYSEVKKFPLINHEISIVGYSVNDQGEEYWIGRNSWGTYWADYGFFYIKMHSDNLAIERNCLAGTPSFEKPGAEVVQE